MNEVHPIITELLKLRGVCDPADVLEFLADSPKRTYDPFLMKGMRAGVDLTCAHLERGSRICIYGDYDTDGVTSVTLMLTALGRLTGNLTYYIPSRFGEGYGLNREAIDIIHADGTDLIITVDCGSVSFDEVNYAKELGMDVIVTDHHTITDKQADCILINPKQPDETYPFDSLAGVGVAFKFVQALMHEGKLPKSIISDCIDLAALGTIGDIMPLIDENRTIVKFGLREMNRGRRSGLVKLVDAAGLHMGSIRSDNVAFVIVPHINAAGRLEDASLGVKLLCEDKNLANRGISAKAKGTELSTAELVSELVNCNKERKMIQQEVYEACLDIIDKEPLGNAIVVYAGNAHEGITGIVAGKIKDKFYRPTLIITETGEEGLLKGTGRSIAEVNLYELLKRSENLFTKFGGHKGACGFSMPTGNLPVLRENLALGMQELCESDDKLLERKSPAEMHLELSEVSFELAQQLEKLAPFGAANPSPIFEIDNVRIEKIFFMGPLGSHVKFTAIGPDGSSAQCVFFSRAQEYTQILYDGNYLDIAASIEISEWNGQRRIQLNIQGLQEAEAGNEHR